jgi:hypothetical protein
MAVGCGGEITVEACSFISAQTERSELPRGQERLAQHGKYPSRPIMRRVSAVAAPGGVFIRRRLTGIITTIV